MAQRAEERSLTEKRLVQLGINALARSPEMDYFADGHRGAALISAHMMCVDNNFNDASTRRIVELFDLNWATSKLCEPFPAGDPVKDATERVGKALAEGGGVLHRLATMRSSRCLPSRHFVCCPRQRPASASTVCVT